jgi:hypothetical protein
MARLFNQIREHPAKIRVSVETTKWPAHGAQAQRAKTTLFARGRRSNVRKMAAGLGAPAIFPMNEGVQE